MGLVKNVTAKVMIERLIARNPERKLKKMKGQTIAATVEERKKSYHSKSVPILAAAVTLPNDCFLNSFVVLAI